MDKKMIDFATELHKDINKLVGTLKDNEALLEVLKRRLTKKEFKYYKLKIEQADDTTMKKELLCDEERLDAIKKQTILKLNQEKIKKELVE
jgi:hypothetical protein